MQNTLPFARRPEIRLTDPNQISSQVESPRRGLTPCKSIPSTTSTSFFRCSIEWSLYSPIEPSRGLSVNLFSAKYIKCCFWYQAQTEEPIMAYQSHSFILDIIYISWCRDKYSVRYIMNSWEIIWYHIISYERLSYPASYVRVLHSFETIYAHKRYYILIYQAWVFIKYTLEMCTKKWKILVKDAVRAQIFESESSLKRRCYLIPQRVYICVFQINTLMPSLLSW